MAKAKTIKVHRAMVILTGVGEIGKVSKEKIIKDMKKSVVKQVKELKVDSPFVRWDEAEIQEPIEEGQIQK